MMAVVAESEGRRVSAFWKPDSFCWRSGGGLLRLNSIEMRGHRNTSRLEKGAILDIVADHLLCAHLSTAGSHFIGQKLFITFHQMLCELRFWNHEYFLGEFIRQHRSHDVPNFVEPRFWIDDKKKIDAYRDGFPLKHVHKLVVSKEERGNV